MHETCPAFHFLFDVQWNVTVEVPVFSYLFHEQLLLYHTIRITDGYLQHNHSKTQTF
jgi:hypothetical protein